MSDSIQRKKSIAIITARGGSKRIPKKNIKDFCGQPILAYSIKAALESQEFDEVMVSTDSKEIAEIAQCYGASVPFFRSEATSGDYASTEDALIEVIEEYKNRGIEFDYVCCIYPTAPFIKADRIVEAMDIMKEHGPALVIPVVPFSYPPQRCFIINEDGYAMFKYPEYILARSQDLEKQYHDVGQFYVYHTEKLLKTKGLIKDDMIPIIIPEMEAQDIDTLEDWKIAELKYKMMYLNK